MAEKTCTECNAECCRDVAVEMEKPETFDDFETLKWFLAHKNVLIYIDHDGDWMVEFKTECKNLDENGRCSIYNERFTICRQHDPLECVANGEGNFFKRVFRTSEDVDNYMKEIGFCEKYEEEKQKQTRGQ